MKKLVFILLCFFASKFFPQTFWTETFNNGCGANCVANGVNTGNGAWAVTSLPGDANPLAGDLPNQWYISCAENGHTMTVCGTGCVAASAANTLASLHMGSTSAGDIGAAYDAGGLCGFLWCTNTHKRVQSPLISTIGKTTITLSFDYIEFGQGATDDFYAVQYSINGGATWITLANPAKTTCCGGTGVCNGFRQGRWNTFTFATLPVACENIANLLIAFVWINNDDGLGTDPSCAIDNMILSTPIVTPIELVDFYYQSQTNSTELLWKTATEKNSDYYEIQKSEDGLSFAPIGKVPAAFYSYTFLNYSFNDYERLNGIAYYRLKMVDKDNTYKYSKLIAVNEGQSLSSTQNYFLNKDNQVEINRNFTFVNGYDSFSILNPEGKTLATYNLADYSYGDKILIPTQNISQGIYLGQLKGYSAQKSFKFFVSQ